MVNSHRERLISGLGGGVAILTVFALTRQAELALHSSILMIASMGASAVLLFAVPHGPMSQPWNVIGGHMISAAIGVAVHRAVADTVLASALAAWLAITAMYYLRCLHPPGGATSLLPILLGAEGDSYGYLLVLFPVGFGAVVLVTVATLYNLPFEWRRYPLTLWSRTAGKPKLARGYPDISHADFVAALAEIDTYVDISEEDLLRIYRIATRRDAGDHSR